MVAVQYLSIWLLVAGDDAHQCSPAEFIRMLEETFWSPRFASEWASRPYAVGDVYTRTFIDTADPKKVGAHEHGLQSNVFVNRSQPCQGQACKQLPMPVKRV